MIKKNKKKNSEYRKKYHQRPEVQERIKRWREENREYLRKKNKEWGDKNREYKRKKDREYQKRITRDPELRKKRLEKQKRFREKDRDRIKEYNQKYHNSEKGKIKYLRHNHLRLSKNFGNEFKLDKEEIKEIYNRDKKCVYCGEKNNLELDHIVPLNKGGKSLFNNYVVCCRRCNPSKADKNVFKWCEEQKIEVPKIVIDLLNEQKKN
ncbi:MAG: HNH endonuclease [Promethearchaeota archaeon]